MSLYTGFASVYDELMMDVDYDGWARFYISLMEGNVLQGGRICECACGTGNITMHLYDYGYQVTGVDLSAEMLSVAAQKARDTGRDIPFIMQDMRDIRLHHPQDAILCTNDGINYLCGEKELKQFFASAFRSLQVGGMLCFDLSTPYKLKNVLGNHFIGDETENISYLWQNRYSAQQDCVRMNIAIFKRLHDEEYHRILETQCQYAHSTERITRLLEESGFEKISVYGDKRMQQPLPNEYRWFVTAVKSEKAKVEDQRQ